MTYIQLPRFLLTDAYKNMSSDAKLLYALLLDRAGISKVNDFTESDGTVKVIFKVDEAQKKLSRARQCVTKTFRELEDAGLIIRRKQGQCRAAIITLRYPADAKTIENVNL